MNAKDNTSLDSHTRKGDTSKATKKSPATAGKAGSFSNEGFGFLFYIIWKLLFLGIFRCRVLFQLPG